MSHVCVLGAAVQEHQLRISVAPDERAQFAGRLDFDELPANGWWPVVGEHELFAFSWNIENSS